MNVVHSAEFLFIIIERFINLMGVNILDKLWYETSDKVILGRTSSKFLFNRDLLFNLGA